MGVVSPMKGVAGTTGADVVAHAMQEGHLGLSADAVDVQSTATLQEDVHLCALHLQAIREVPFRLMFYS